MFFMSFSSLALAVFRLSLGPSKSDISEHQEMAVFSCFPSFPDQVQKLSKSVEHSPLI